MNPQINKVANDIRKTKDKIAELQTLLPELERKKIELENAEIVRLVRKASVAPGELAGFLDSIKPPQQPSGHPHISPGQPVRDITAPGIEEAFGEEAGPLFNAEDIPSP
jgi:hypothetical protein